MRYLIPCVLFLFCDELASMIALMILLGMFTLEVLHAWERRQHDTDS